MKIIRLGYILFFFSLISFQFSAQSQKANVETIKNLCSEKKFEEAYTLVNTKSFKYKKKEIDEYTYLYSTVCKELYHLNPGINSPYRNEGIKIATGLLYNTNSERVSQGVNIIKSLTTTIYDDIIANVNSKNNPDTILLGDFTTETIQAFEWFTVPTNLDDSTLYLIGSTFYNDGVFIVTRMIDFDSDLELITDRANRSVALFNVASLFFKSLCGNHNLHCDTYKMILGALGKTE